MSHLLVLFILAKSLKFLAELKLSSLNRDFYQNKANQQEACELLQVSQEKFSKTLAYTNDKYQFGLVSSWINFLVILAFLALGGLGMVEKLAVQLSPLETELGVGLTFFAILGLLSFVFSLPFEHYFIFKIEEAHGFNKQDQKSFFADKIKMILLSSILGGALLSGLLWAMSLGENWWFWAWVLLSGFSLLTSWIYPSVLAPLFNTFSPLEEGSLKKQIIELADRIKFRTSGIYIMDASKRTSHGNAYFTGLFGEKRIVLFDTLINSMTPRQVVAVLAHELGHFKLNHVRWALIRSVTMTGGMFYLLSLALPQVDFYHAFALNGVTHYGALVVFSLWFGLIDFILGPLSSWISRTNEFAADAFARTQLGGSEDMIGALIQLRESNHAMPISHPLYSMVYHSHPPLMERIKALADNNSKKAATI